MILSDGHMPSAAQDRCRCNPETSNGGSSTWCERCERPKGFASGPPPASSAVKSHTTTSYSEAKARELGENVTRGGVTQALESEEENQRIRDGLEAALDRLENVDGNLLLTIYDAQVILRAALDDTPSEDACVVGHFSSRTCERGTKGCGVLHGTPSEAI